MPETVPHDRFRVGDVDPDRDAAVNGVFYPFDRAAADPEFLSVVRKPAEELASLDAVFGTIRRGERRDLESASALFTSVLYTWKERIESGENKKNPGKLSGIAEMIVRDRQKNYTVDELAGLCALSVRRFREVFERKFGLPPKKYILKAKMERAYELLISTSMSVSAVAESVGYADGFYFSKAFRQFFGLSPSGVRKNAALLSD